MESHVSKCRIGIIIIGHRAWSWIDLDNNIMYQFQLG